jgi:acyl carrier protein
MSVDVAEVRRRVKSTIVSSLELEIDLSSIGDETLLFASGLAEGLDLDSLAAIDILVGLSNEFGIALDEVPRESFQNVETLADFIVTKLDIAVVG